MKAASDRSLLVIKAAFATTVALVNTAGTAFAEPQTSLIVQQVEDATRVRLVGNVSPYATPEHDMGPAPRTLLMNELAFVLRHAPAQERTLNQLLSTQQDPKSPSYHQWLTPEQFGSKFGASDSDIRTVSAWLRAHGFTVGALTRGRDLLHFSGTETQVETSFHTGIHYFDVNGQRHWANVADPEIPAAFAPAIAGVVGLHNFRPVPQHRNLPTTVAHSLRPMFNTGIGYYGVSPTDFATIYNVQPLWNKGITGNGATIAIAAMSDVNPSTPPAFWSAFGAAQSQTLRVIVPPGMTDPGETGDANEGEADLDIEVAGGIAQAATIILVPSASLVASVEYAIDNNLAPILNISFGECELGLGSAGNTQVATLYQQAAAQGITVLVAAGDQGAAACDRGATATPAPAIYGLAVNGLASTPFNTAVGGTDFNFFGVNESQYWSATNSSGTFADATSYMPEMPWNESCANPILLQWAPSYPSVEAICNDPANAALVMPIGGGGGLSACIAPLGGTPATCVGSYAQPYWQSGVLGIPTTSSRAMPDVSFFASSGSVFGTAWVICDFANTTCDPNGSLGGTDGYQLIGGTSASAPAFAGVIALLLQTQVSASNPDGRLGLINPTLYQLAATEYGSTQAPNAVNLNSCNSNNGNAVGGNCIFYNTTAGSNAEPCATSSADCVTQTSGDAYGILEANATMAYPAGAGFNLATGLGSLNIANFVSALWVAPAPTNLAATPGNGTIALQWTTSSRAQSYNVYEGTASGGEATMPVQSGITTNSVTITGLANGQLYFYKIAAVNGGGTSAPSNEASATVLPSTPTGLTAKPGNGTIALAWGASAGAAYYSIFQGSSSGGEAPTPVQTGMTGTSVTLSGLNNGNAYYFYVTANNAGGSSASSNEASATVLPATPTTLLATAGNGAVTLSWAASAGATTYNVYQGTSSGGEAAAPVQSNVIGTSVTLSGLSNGQAYFFRVAAVNNGGTSAMSNEAAAIPTAPTSGGGGGGGGATDLPDLLVLGVLLAFRLRSYRNRRVSASRSPLLPPIPTINNRSDVKALRYTTLPMTV